MLAWVNGEYLKWDKVTVPILSHSFGRGSAIFEVLNIVAAKDGPAYFGLNEHIERFFNSANLLSMAIPLTKDKLASALIETARENKATQGFAKFFAYYPLFEMGLIPENTEVKVAIFCFDFAFLKWTQKDLSAPVSAGISSWKKLDPETVPIHAKVVGHYVNSYIAKTEVIKKGYQDVIMFDTSGRVAEGGYSNLFFIKEGGLRTPTLENVLSGITRKVVLDLAEDMGIPTEERDIYREELKGFDEAFYTNTFGKIQPIRSIEGRQLGSSCPGPTTSILLERIKDVYTGKIKRYGKWLTYIK